jgi:rhamnosyltransferase
LISANVLQEVGLMNESLFIDWVDVEWGLRAQTYGLANYVTPTVMMDHSIGDSFVKLGTKIIYKHNDLRNFYIVRNACYLAFYRRFKFAWHFTVLIKIPLYIIFYIWSAQGSKWRVFKALLQAVWLGIRGKLGPAPVNLL